MRRFVPRRSIARGRSGRTRRREIFTNMKSNGRMTQNQFIVNFRTMLNTGITLFGNYRLGFANGDTDGAGTLSRHTPTISSDEYGRSSFDIRHNFVIGGNINLPHGISLEPVHNRELRDGRSISRAASIRTAIFN